MSHAIDYEPVPDAEIAGSAYCNADFAPTTPEQRRWGIKDVAVLWISMCACVPTYMLASSLISEGMNWWQAIATITLANAVVLVPMVLNAHAGTKYGIPFPIYCRAAFGIRGANVPALLRALVACGWFGIQTWIGGEAIYEIVLMAFPGVRTDPIPGVGINPAQLACFMVFWGLNVAVIWAGIESIRLLLNFKAPVLIALGLILLGWAYSAAHGFGPMLSQPSAFDAGQPKAGQFWSFFFPALTANVGFWATLALNIPDFSRYAKSQRAQAVGQALGLPTTMALFSFIGVAVTSATIVIFNEPKGIWDPVALLHRFRSKTAIAIALVALVVATLATNIAANVVSPANDFAHLNPRKISFRLGGLITGVLGILIMPWKLLADPGGYIFTWLIAYSALLGGIGGILIVDYFAIRRTRLALADLYRAGGRYWYFGGVNPVAVAALAIGIAPCVPGFLGTIKVTAVGQAWMSLYNYAWFISFALAAAAYWAGAAMCGRGRPAGRDPMFLSQQRMARASIVHPARRQ